MGSFITIYKIVEGGGAGIAFIGVDEDELDLHTLRNYTLYVDCRHSSRDVAIAQEGDIVAQLCEPCEVWCELDEYSVALDTSYYPCDSLPRGEECGVFLPRAQQLAH